MQIPVKFRVKVHFIVLLIYVNPFAMISIRYTPFVAKGLKATMYHYSLRYPTNFRFLPISAKFMNFSIPWSNVCSFCSCWPWPPWRPLISPWKAMVTAVNRSSSRNRFIWKKYRRKSLRSRRRPLSRFQCRIQSRYPIHLEFYHFLKIRSVHRLWAVQYNRTMSTFSFKPQAERSHFSTDHETR